MAVLEFSQSNITVRFYACRFSQFHIQDAQEIEKIYWTKCKAEKLYLTMKN